MFKTNTTQVFRMVAEPSNMPTVGQVQQVSGAAVACTGQRDASAGSACLSQREAAVERDRFQEYRNVHGR